MFKGCKQGVHKFEPRYDETGPEWLTVALQTGNVPAEVSADAMEKDKRYICDVCVRCGLVADARKQAVTGMQAIPGNLFGAGLSHAKA